MMENNISRWRLNVLSRWLHSSTFCESTLHISIQLAPSKGCKGKLSAIDYVNLHLTNKK